MMFHLPKHTLLISTVALLSLILFLNGCQIVEGSGDVVEEERSVTHFNAISLSGEGTLNVHYGEVPGLIIQADDNFMEYIETCVSNGKLKISVQDGVLLTDITSLEYTVITNDLESLSIAGSGKVVGQDPFMINDLNIDISGSGSVCMEVDAESVHGNISGSGDIFLQGSAQYSSMEIHGSGNVKAFGLNTSITQIDVHGSGDVEVTVQHDLDVQISGSGDVKFRGHPEVSSRISGSGSLRQE